MALYVLTMFYRVQARSVQEHAEQPFRLLPSGQTVAADAHCVVLDAVSNNGFTNRSLRCRQDGNASSYPLKVFKLLLASGSSEAGHC